MYYYISKGKTALVTAQFEEFNSNFQQLERVFQEVTGRAFLPGQQFSQVLQIFPGFNGIDWEVKVRAPGKETDSSDAPIEQSQCHRLKKKKKCIFGGVLLASVVGLAVVCILLIK